MSGEYWAGWFDQWGQPHHKTNLEAQVRDLGWMLDRGYSINIYLFHGGTTFGFMNGANIDHDQYSPQTTSYDYDAALDESGRPTPKYFAFRDLIAKYTHATPPPVPRSDSVIAIPPFTLSRSTSLWTQLGHPVHVERPLSMEALGQSYGYILYRTTVAGPAHGMLMVRQVRDYAQVYVDGVSAGTLDRRLGQDSLPIVLPSSRATLDILVENSGRVNFTKALRDERKGITQSVSFAGRELLGWDVFLLPMSEMPRLSIAEGQVNGPAFYQGTFKIADVGDTYLDMHGWGKGTVWVNGHHLGRFWGIGPQQTLYLPGPWLRVGSNDILVFDLEQPLWRTMAGVARPILDEVHAPRLAKSALYRDPGASVSDRVHDLLVRMTPDEKFWQLFMIPGDLDSPANDYTSGIFGLQISAIRERTPSRDSASAGDMARADAERINAIQRFFVQQSRLGIPIIPFDEAVHGLVRDGATMFPQAIALAATWDTALVSRVAGAIAHEAGSRGIRQVLSPVINIAADSRWGRVEETYGEDPSSRRAWRRHSSAPLSAPVLWPRQSISSRMWAMEVVTAIPSTTISGCWMRCSSLRLRRQLPKGEPRSVMVRITRWTGCQRHRTVHFAGKLKGEWGFQGFVISDAAATGGATVLHHTEASTATATKDALEAGLDVIFQSSWEQHRPYLDAFRSGLIPDSVIDTAVSRVLRAKFALGLFDHPEVDADSAAFWNGNRDHRALALDAARASIVLLKNEHGVLPLSRSVRSVAVIGSDANEARLGGYSGPGIHRVSILEGMREKFGPFTNVRYAPGPGRVTPEYAVIPSEQLALASAPSPAHGLCGEYFDNNRLEGQPRIVRTDARVDFGWTLNSPGRGIPFDWYSVRWTGRLIVPRTGVHRLGVEGNDGYRLYLDGMLIIDNWKKQSLSHDLCQCHARPRHIARYST